MFVPKIDDGMPVRQTALAEIDRVVSERLGRARVAGNAQPAAFNRQVAMYLANRVGGWSLAKIGKFYNGRHHTTVCHAIRRIEALRQVNPDVDGLLAVLIDQIKAVGVCRPSRREPCSETDRHHGVGFTNYRGLLDDACGPPRQPPQSQT